jgi:hypothetical protein
MNSEVLLLLLLTFCGNAIDEVVEKAATKKPFRCRRDAASNIIPTSKEIEVCLDRTIPDKNIYKQMRFVSVSPVSDIQAVDVDGRLWYPQIFEYCGVVVPGNGECDVVTM